MQENLSRPTAYGGLALLCSLLAACGMPIQHKADTTGEVAKAPAAKPAHNRGPDVPNEYMYLQRADHTGKLNTTARRAALQTLRQQKAQKLLSASAAAQWQLVGPYNTSGRVTDVVGDPLNSNKFYVATASGGVFKTLDGGASFVPIFDQSGGSLSIGALALDPRNSDVIYVGTGEANPGGGSVSQPGDGLWKSSDGGASWRLLGLDKSINIGTIAIDKNNPDTLFVAVPGNLYEQTSERGVYRSTDAGQSWQLVHSVGTKAGAIDVHIDPSDSRRIYAVMWERVRKLNQRAYGGPASAIWRSQDGGNTWSQLSNGLPAASTNPGRIAFAQAASSPATLYAMYSDTAGVDTGLYKSTNYGDSWSKLNSSGLSGICGGYCWWFGNIWVNPKDANDLFVDGVGLVRSTNGGTSFSSVGGMHADHHAQWWSPSTPGMVLKGNDGGLYKSTNGGGTWTKFNNLPITQFYAIEAHPTNQAILAGGAQDNGTVRGSNPASWSSIYGGDGFTVLIDPSNPNYMYAESQFGALGRSTDGGTNFSSATSGLSGRKPWHSAYVLDPNNPAVLYFGTHMLHRSDNRAVSWKAITGDLSDGDQSSGGVVYGTISTIAVAPSNSNEIYVGTDDGNLHRVTRSGTSYTSKKINLGLPKRWVTAIAVDPLQAGTVYVAFSGFAVNDNSAMVYRSTDYGTSWVAVSNGLPNAPVNDIVVDKANPATLYLANDVGVYVSRNSGANWEIFGTGMPEVVVSSLKYSAVNGVTKLFAGTYGRAIYSTTLSSTPPAETTLSNCVALNAAPIAANGWAHFKLPLGAAAAKLVSTTSATGDADLYVRKGGPASSTAYDCKSTGATGSETCTLNAPTAANYYLSVFAYSAVSNLVVKGCAQ